jgi:hypothetical protein
MIAKKNLNQSKPRGIVAGVSPITRDCATPKVLQHRIPESAQRVARSRPGTDEMEDDGGNRGDGGEDVCGVVWLDDCGSTFRDAAFAKVPARVHGKAIESLQSRDG